ncbi:hypothetical protein BFJ63_vAg8225 [Fusarium oxysporum f. sp. narcissi]|jgi:hypothetical protein|uniref:Uncharacterized protein n=2 Tax=Fusarium oxysporum TaxID=5507 RepID=A0A4Q2VQQ9_FUSOX|nr:hypothetical protein BFJ65_g5476 [Fusarium oxysporum f. sp. cepae]RKK54708.1 hypothetical protein BFJ66_g4420 [Fusarium oxysporum f. sp. cepae]RKK56795.1 hypothetical protein BFJ67_g3729 [Fusarium oxysporum f. sp. cepae]RKL28622.1 hypothetical protein BFJ70_g11023 [Fusarium oxysporum]RYC88936.1 hypothetical protein BFJ63_vAg8225 [Fusarium oxysporum f. sp. narcissi]
MAFPLTALASLGLRMLGLLARQPVSELTIRRLMAVSSEFSLAAFALG